jgi:site-specific DNA recombinase
MAPMAKKLVVCCRYSTDMQNPKSCEDQEHDVRAGLTRLGIDHRLAVVIHDDAESGTNVLRPGFQILLDMSRRREIGILAVDDQARLTRAGNAFNFILDLVFDGGRFISTGENIDTALPGWELRVKMVEMHNSMTVSDVKRLVRRGQEGRIRSHLTAGDYPYGYESFFVNPEAVIICFSRRGPKPEKDIRINEAEARWVRQMFVWFVNGLSLHAIARMLNKAGVPLARRCRVKKWEARHISEILSNEKYTGYWVFGKTMTIRNSAGKKKQIDVPPEGWTIADRPDLRIVDQLTWDQAQARLAQLADVFGPKEGQKKRGRKAQSHYSDVYPTGLLNGLLFCEECGAKLHHRGSGKNIYLGCPNAILETCSIHTFVPVEKAKRALLDCVHGILLGTPDWAEAALTTMHSALSELSSRVPSEIVADEKRLAGLHSQIENLVDSLAQSGIQSDAVMERLTALEAAKKSLQERIEAARRLPALPSKLPDKAWLIKELGNLAAVLEEDVSNSAKLLRKLLGKVTAHAIIPPGKKRGFIQLRFRIDYWEAICLSLTPDSRLALEAALVGAQDVIGVSDEFRLDIGGPSRMDQWGPKIAEMRRQGLRWKDITEITGLGLGPAYVAWERFVDHEKKAGDADAADTAASKSPDDLDRGENDAA